MLDYFTVNDLGNLSTTGVFVNRIYLPLLREHLSGKVKLVLDVGCGTKPLRRVTGAFEGVTHVGVDIYPGKNVDVVFDGERLPFKEASFDLVLYNSVLEHTRNPAALIGDIRRVLRKGGRVLSSVPFANHIHAAPYDFWWPTYWGLNLLFEGFSAKRVYATTSFVGFLANAVTARIILTIQSVGKRLYGGGSRADTRGGSSPEYNSLDAMARRSILARLAKFLLIDYNIAVMLIGLAGFVVDSFIFDRKKSGGNGELTPAYVFSMVK